MIEIIPAILTNSQEEFEKAVRLIEPYATRVQLDIADGIFVPNETIRGYREVSIVSTGLMFDVHLMVKDPVSHINLWESDKADRFIVHIESEDVSNAIKELRQRNKGVGLALNPDTPTSSIEPFIGSVDIIQFMTINPGFQGRDFLDYIIKKIKDFHDKYPDTIIAVDGGMNLATAQNVIDAGASVLISGSFILKSGNVGKAIEELKKIGENITAGKSAS